MTKPVPEREAAKAAGERFYWTGKPCRNGHVSKRYTGTGLCAICAVKNTLRSQAKQPEHPNRIAAREAGLIHYSIGVPCKNGHDLRFVSNGVCVECTAERQKRYHASRPGLEAKWARERRAKDPTGHRQSSLKWAKDNPEKIRAYREIMFSRNPEAWRDKWRSYANNYRALKSGNGGSFTPDDIQRLYEKQLGQCDACDRTGRLEVDHILALSRGGTSDPENLQLLCRKCNRSKGNKNDEDWRVKHGFRLRESPN